MEVTMPSFQHGTATLHYELEGSGPDALYICGMGSHSNDLLGLMIRQTLSAQYRLLTVDNRGSGQTITPDGDRVTFNDMADDIVAVMDEIGMKKVRLLGISLGGMIGLTLTTRYPERIERQVIAVSSARTPDNPSRSEFFLRAGHVMRVNNLPQEYINRHYALMVLGESVFADMPAIIEAFENAPADPLRQSLEGFDLQAQALVGYDVRESLKMLNIPTLVLSSSEDLLVPPRYQDEIAALISGAQIKRYLGGHVYMMLPPNAPQFFADVFEFWAGA
jgi:3-oxoadipate enol-lactonase